jgi:hypothetical protein
MQPMFGPESKPFNAGTPLEPWSSTWSASTPGGTRRHLKRHVKIEKKKKKKKDKHWIIRADSMINHRRPGHKVIWFGSVISPSYNFALLKYVCLFINFYDIGCSLLNVFWDRLCGLVVRVPGYRCRGPGFIPGATRFSEKNWVWNGVHSALWVQLRSYLKEKVAAPVQKVENTAVGIRQADHVAPSIHK